MNKSKRHYVPCRNCGASHNNPSSSSICDDCGRIEYIENLQRKEETRKMEQEIEDEDNKQ
jgi:hypothetical protein